MRVKYVSKELMFSKGKISQNFWNQKINRNNFFCSYFKDPDRTQETIDEDGWHHTGDIGMWLDNGTLKIIDRRKHIFKLSQGEYIVPEKIENIYIRSQYIEQVYVYGESLKSCIVAVVVPDVDVIKCWAQENHIAGTLSVLCNNQAIKDLIMSDMLSWGKEGGLRSFEQVIFLNLFFFVSFGIIYVFFVVYR